MSRYHRLARPLVAGIAAALLGACSDSHAPDAASGPADLRIDGSSTVFPLTREAARRFARSAPGSRIEVGFSGTSAGLRRFCAGELDVSNASRELNVEERAQCAANDVRYRRVPLAMDAIAIVVHPDNTWVDHLSVAELRRLWEPAAEKKVNSWSDLREGWPQTPIALFGRGQDSGTYDVFTTAVVGATHRSRLDYQASEDEELLATAIAAQPNALGFFGIGAYHRHWDQLRLVPVDAGAGPVYPTLTTVGQEQYQPLTRPLFLYVNQRSLEQKPLLADFLSHYLQGLPDWIHFTGFMPLAREQYGASVRMLNGEP